MLYIINFTDVDCKYMHILNLTPATRLKKVGSELQAGRSSTRTLSYEATMLLHTFAFAGWLPPLNPTHNLLSINLFTCGMLQTGD